MVAAAVSRPSWATTVASSPAAIAETVSVQESWTTAVASSPAAVAETVSVQDCVRKWARCDPTTRKFAEVFEQGLEKKVQAQRSAFLIRELLVRLARSVTALEDLPGRPLEQAGLRETVRYYTDSIIDLENCPAPLTPTQHQAFHGLLQCSFAPHQDVVNAVAQGARRLVEGHASSDRVVLQSAVDVCLTRFFSMRLGLRFMLQQFCLTRGQRTRPGFSGVLQKRCSPADVAREAARNAQHLCRRQFRRAPPIVITDSRPETLMYPPGELHYALTEIFKNAFRAVLERHGTQKPPPPVICVIAGSEELIELKIRDEGLGMSADQLREAFSFGQSTVAANKSPYTTAPSAKRPSGTLAGYGVGLALSRISLRYFGGDLEIRSAEGAGTDVRVLLNRAEDRIEGHF